MNLISRLFGKSGDEREAVRPLWHRVVEVARDPIWYRDLGVADTVPGRFDLVTVVLALVMLRMDGDPAMVSPSARLTELFVDDMDGQLRQSGIGDLVVGKHVGKLMGALAGRMEALRTALPEGRLAVMPVVERNVTLTPGADPAPLADAVATLAERIAGLSGDDLFAGKFGL